MAGMAQCPQPARALEMLDATLRRIEQGQIHGIEAVDELLLEELSLRENRRITAPLRMARLPVVKTLAGFDFAFLPSRNRTGSWRWPVSTSSTAPRSSAFSDRPAPVRVICGLGLCGWVFNYFGESLKAIEQFKEA
jgi:hypothetical protein